MALPFTRVTKWPGLTCYSGMWEVVWWGSEVEHRMPPAPGLRPPLKGQLNGLHGFGFWGRQWGNGAQSTGTAAGSSVNEYVSPSACVLLTAAPAAQTHFLFLIALWNPASHWLCETHLVTGFCEACHLIGSLRDPPPWPMGSPSSHWPSVSSASRWPASLSGRLGVSPHP